MRALFVLLILVACPLMMFFMMRGMGGVRRRDGNRDGSRDGNRDGSRDAGARRDGRDDRPRSLEPSESDERIAELTREVARLRAARNDHAERPATPREGQR